ncbi:hypothetical protein NL529_28870, partial [Klebsiella pneumoniae]|nr:hypothetical protein [Klebsiella pneumoniae]
IHKSLSVNWTINQVEEKLTGECFLNLNLDKQCVRSSENDKAELWNPEYHFIIKNGKDGKWALEKVRLTQSVFPEDLIGRNKVFPLVRNGD